MAAELGNAAVSGVASKGAELLFDSIKQNISYVFKYQSHVEALRIQAKELERKREMVEQPVVHARRQGDEVYKSVEEWLIRVDEFVGKIKPIIDDEDEAKKPCFKGLCPNLFKCYNLSKKAVHAAKEGADLLGRGNFSTVVSYRLAPDKSQDMLVRGYQQFDSRLKIFQDVMEALKDSNVDMIGVYGMGGVGKTTLVKQVAKQVKENVLFDEVVMAEVTQTPDHKTIQDKIARDLGLEFAQHESVFQRSDRLRERLKKEKRVLVILDNIWTKLDLGVVGIPFEDDGNERKDNDQRRLTIILTSRSRDLLHDDMNSQKNFSVEVLSKEEAKQLFEKIVGDKTKKSDFQPIADEIVKRCGGLPVALNTIANALKNKSLPIWKDALDQLRKSNLREIHGMNANVSSSIELSYKFLESEEAKSLFLLCALHRAGDLIRVPYLLRYGVGLGLFKNVYTLDTARNRVHRLIGILKASSLLLDGDTEDWVKMHDIIHDVAVSIATEKLMFNIPNVDDLKEEIEKTMQKGPSAISLPGRDVFELPERLACPKLKLFLLFSRMYGSLQIPDLFFEGMGELRVLHFDGINFPALPSSLVGCLTSLQTLALERCQLGDVAIIGELTKLEILSFRGSDIKKLPAAIGQLTRLWLLDLSYCCELEVIAPNVISRLSRLKELLMGDSLIRWEKVEGRSNASLVELTRLLKLTTLDIHIEDAQIVPHDLFPVELERYRISIGTMRTWYESETTKRLMKIERLGKNILLGHRMKVLLKRTEDLCLRELKGFQNVVPELDDGEGFQQLRHLCVDKCSEVLHISSSLGRVGRNVFPLLESLYLHKLVNLEKICHNKLIEDQSFNNLKIMNISYCHRLKHLFSFSVAKNLLQLQDIYVRGCENLNMIVGPDVENPATASASKAIITGNASNENVIFPNLVKLMVVDCESLKCIFSYSMVKSLVRLQHLDIWNCKSMEWVFDTTSTELERDEVNLIDVFFPKLHYLRLYFLPKLTSFAIAMGIHSVEFPSLLELDIFDCFNLRRFISMSSSEDNIYTETQRQPVLFDEKVGLPNLEILTIKWMNNLRQIWHHQLVSDSLSKLKNLKIVGCDELMNIFPTMVGLSNLEVLDIEVMKSLKEIWHHQIASYSFSKLNKLVISNCYELTSIFPPMMEFPSLESVSVIQCNKIEEIIRTVGEGPQENFIAFGQLKHLMLYELPKLTSFCLENYTLQFPSLKRANVVHFNDTASATNEN